jgi:hypothetical protein
MSKPKNIKSSDLNASNRRLLYAAQQAGLSSDEIIRKSVEAAYGRLRRPVKKPGRTPAAARNNHKPATNKSSAKPSALAVLPGANGKQSQARRRREFFSK